VRERVYERELPENSRDSRLEGFLWRERESIRRERKRERESL